jgi:hypothetical protein
MRAGAKKACILPRYKVEDKRFDKLKPKIKRKIAEQRKPLRREKKRLPRPSVRAPRKSSIHHLIREIVRLPPVRASHSFLPRRVPLEFLGCAGP